MLILRYGPDRTRHVEHVMRKLEHDVLSDVLFNIQ